MEGHRDPQVLAGDEIPVYAFLWFLTLPLAAVPLVLAGGRWFDVTDPFFPIDDPPQSTLWEAEPWVGATLIAVAAAAALFLVLGVPASAARPRWPAWRPAALLLLITSVGATVAVLLTTLSPPDPVALGEDPRQRLEVFTSPRPILALCCLIALALIAAVVLWVLPDRSYRRLERGATN